MMQKGVSQATVYNAFKELKEEGRAESPRHGFLKIVRNEGGDST